MSDKNEGLAIPGGPENAIESNALAPSSPKTDTQKNRDIFEPKPNLLPSELAAFWSLPLAPLTLLADVLNTTPQGVGRMGFATYRIGGGLYVRPQEISHGFRALKAEGGAK